MQLNLDYEKGFMDEETYHRKEAEVLKDLNTALEQKKVFS
jgi:hypothetical protein